MNPTSTPVRLGELDCPSALDSLFQLGELLARTNAAGDLVLPDFLAKVTMTYPVGRWHFKSASQVMPGAFAPTEAAGQFAGLEGESLRVILGGYARLAYQLLEPGHPGFTDGLLAQLFPGAEVVVPRPRPVRFDIERILRAYGATLVPRNHEPGLALPAPAPPQFSATDEELLLTTLAVFVAQMNLTGWLFHIAACEPKRELSKLVVALVKGKFHVTDLEGVLVQVWRWVVPRPVPHLADQSELAGVVLKVLGNVYDGPDRLAEVYAKRTPFKVLRAVLDQLPPARQAVRATLLAGLMDGQDALAHQADAQGQAIASIQFAQLSLVALQLLPCPAEPVAAEAWLARLQAQERSYSWSKTSPEQALTDGLVWNYASYAGSARLMAEYFCHQAGDWYAKGQISNQLWSANWFALERLRLALRLFYALSQQQPWPDVSKHGSAYIALKYLLDHYHQAQLVMAQMIDRNLKPGRDMSTWVQTMLDEGATTLKDTQAGYDIQWCVAVKEALQQGDIPETLQRLGQLVSTLNPIAAGPPISLSITPELEAYRAEEDELYRQVLPGLLRSQCLTEAESLKLESGAPLIPPPPDSLRAAEREAYYESWIARHSEVFPSRVLNLATTLRSLPECLDEYQSLLEQPTQPARSQVLQKLAAQANVGTLLSRAFEPTPAPETWQYALHWRYTPYHQYPDPVGSWGHQTGLHLSRVCFNTTRDTGLFFYDLDHNNYILGNAVLVRKQQGRWTIQEGE